jgi:hypothetical protein
VSKEEDRKIEALKSLENWMHKPYQDEEFIEKLVNLLSYLKSSCGRNPFELEIIECERCKNKMNIWEAYRCYECNMRMHKNCLRYHCEESKKTNRTIF